MCIPWPWPATVSCSFSLALTRSGAEKKRCGERQEVRTPTQEGETNRNASSHCMMMRPVPPEIVSQRRPCSSPVSYPDCAGFHPGLAAYMRASSRDRGMTRRSEAEMAWFGASMSSPVSYFFCRRLIGGGVSGCKAAMPRAARASGDSDRSPLGMEVSPCGVKGKRWMCPTLPTAYR